MPGLPAAPRIHVFVLIMLYTLLGILLVLLLASALLESVFIGGIGALLLLVLLVMLLMGRVPVH